MPRLSVCLITRNEEVHLPRCLASLAGLWDDLVVVDTGSTDQTVAVAESFGARVFAFDWIDDFSAARNFCKAQALGDWILSIDADESLAARDHATIRQLLDSDRLFAALAWQRHYLTETVAGWQAGSGGYEEGASYPGYLDVECRRLFRNVPWLRWHSRVHEEIRSTDPARPLVEAHGGFVIHHFGKVGARDLLRAKGEAYLRIARKKILDEPASPQAHYELGMTLAELRRHEEALPCFERALDLAPRFRDSCFRVAICHARADRPDAALAAFARAARELPHLTAVIALEEGNIHRKCGGHDAARRSFERALRIDPSLAAASLNLAALHNAASSPSSALQVLDGAIARHPAHAELRLLRARTRCLLGDVDGALADLNDAPSDGDARRLRARLLLQTGRFDEAQRAIEEATEAPDADLLCLRGVVALGQGRLAAAVAALEQSLHLDATEEAALNLSIALEAQRDVQGALDAAASALVVAPASGVAIARFQRLRDSAASLATSRANPHERGALRWYFYHPRSLVYDGHTPRRQGLGGTESAVVYLAEALAGQGHQVTVFNQGAAGITINGVEYAEAATLIPRAAQGSPDVLVTVRDWELAGRVRLAPLQIFWTGDAHDQPFLAHLADPSRRAHLDFVMLQSAWQEQTFREQHALPEQTLLRTRLGSAASAECHAPPVASHVRPPRLAYISTPFRGLDTLLLCFPVIRAACPDAELDVYSSLGVYGVSSAEDERQFGGLYAMAAQPGVRMHGSISQPELARHLEHVRLLAYPNCFPETFCIAAIEAQAAGCVVVTSALGALPQTVGEGGICVPGDPRSAGFRQAFVDECVRLLTDDAAWLAYHHRAVVRAWRDYTWRSIADDWSRLVHEARRPEPPLVQRIAAHIGAGRVALAQRMAVAEREPDGCSSEAWEALRAYTAWRAGSGEPLSPSTRRLVHLRFPSLRAV